MPQPFPLAEIRVPPTVWLDEDAAPILAANAAEALRAHEERLGVSFEIDAAGLARLAVYSAAALLWVTFKRSHALRFRKARELALNDAPAVVLGTDHKGGFLLWLTATEDADMNDTAKPFTLADLERDARNVVRQSLPDLKTAPTEIVQATMYAAEMVTRWGGDKESDRAYDPLYLADDELARRGLPGRPHFDGMTQDEKTTWHAQQAEQFPGIAQWAAASIRRLEAEDNGPERRFGAALPSDGGTPRDDEAGASFLAALDTKITEAKGVFKDRLSALRGDLELGGDEIAASVGRDIRLNQGFMKWDDTRELVGDLLPSTEPTPPKDGGPDGEAVKDTNDDTRFYRVHRPYGDADNWSASLPARAAVELFANDYGYDIADNAFSAGIVLADDGNRQHRFVGRSYNDIAEQIADGEAYWIEGSKLSQVFERTAGQERPTDPTPPKYGEGERFEPSSWEPGDYTPDARERASMLDILRDLDAKASVQAIMQKEADDFAHTPVEGPVSESLHCLWHSNHHGEQYPETIGEVLSVLERDSPDAPWIDHGFEIALTGPGDDGEASIWSDAQGQPYRLKSREGAEDFLSIVHQDIANEVGAGNMPDGDYKLAVVRADDPEKLDIFKEIDLDTDYDPSADPTPTEADKPMTADEIDAAYMEKVEAGMKDTPAPERSPSRGPNIA